MTAQSPLVQETDDTSELLALLTEQRDLYAELAALADHQRQLIAADQAERLLEVLGQRQRLVNRLGTLADRLRRFQANWREIRAGMDQPAGQEADDLVAQTNGLLSAILEKDEADVQLLASRKTATAEAMTGLKKHRQAGEAYAAAQQAASSGVDWTDA